jgi:Uma2 family endonuclease
MVDPKDPLAIFDALDAQLPEGYRAEFIEGTIIVTPPADRPHESVFSRITNQLIRKAAIEFDISGGCGLSTPLGRFIPDMTVAERGTFDEGPSWGDARGILLVLETTASHPAIDREAKRRAYAAAGIPLYLLVDRKAREVALFSTPEGEKYHAELRVAFGKPIELPEPFSCTLEDVVPQ